MSIYRVSIPVISYDTTEIIFETRYFETSTGKSPSMTEVIQSLNDELKECLSQEVVNGLYRIEAENIEQMLTAINHCDTFPVLAGTMHSKNTFTPTTYGRQPLTVTKIEIKKLS